MNPVTLAFVALCIAFLTLIFGGGAVVNFWHASTEREKQQAVSEYRLAALDKVVAELTKQFNKVESGLALTDQNLLQVHDRLKKLDLLETVVGQMNILMARTENILPRPEAETKFNDISRRVQVVEDAVQELEHPQH